MAKARDLLQGTLDLLILKALSLGAMHGYGVLLRIEQLSQDILQIPQGSLYPALYRLEHRGWICSETGSSDNNRKARFYRLTPRGRRQLEAEEEQWNRLSGAVGQVLRATEVSS
ncbi:MAG: PadR family transcriptional regulator [Thermoanaerobaculia bacterium]|nr:PadR family transcriptional regulator [Thermoanaerobaculia bacterium]